MSFMNRKRRYRKQHSFSKKDLHPSWLGDPKGALRQYRDAQETNSLHIREYLDKVCVHRDQFNPEFRPIEHLIYDVNPTKQSGILIGGTLGGIIGGIVTKKALGTILGATVGAVIGYFVVE